jgi:hyperosmotically inducible protein
MRALLLVGCGAIAAACASNKPAEEPAHFSDTPAVGANSATDPAKTPDYHAPNGPSDSTQVGSATDTSPPRADSTAGNGQFSTMGNPTPTPPPAAAPAPAPAPATAATGDGASRPDADNTRVNKRDRGGATLTPMDQSNDHGDLTITQDIRKAVMADSSLSFSAKNVKIITQGGKVTLRGAVKSDQERKAIDDSARKVAGAGNVDNQLEVKK